MFNCPESILFINVMTIRYAVGKHRAIVFLEVCYEVVKVNLYKLTIKM